MANPRRKARTAGSARATTAKGIASMLKAAGGTFTGRSVVRNKPGIVRVSYKKQDGGTGYFDAPLSGVEAFERSRRSGSYTSSGGQGG